jgi:hypothetical protein
MIKGVVYEPASIIYSTLIPLFPTENAIYSMDGFSGFFNRQSEFLAQLQRIVAQRHKIVYEDV